MIEQSKYGAEEISRLRIVEAIKFYRWKAEECIGEHRVAEKQQNITEAARLEYELAKFDLKAAELKNRSEVESNEKGD